MAKTVEHRGLSANGGAGAQCVGIAQLPRGGASKEDYSVPDAFRLGQWRVGADAVPGPALGLVESRISAFDQAGGAFSRQGHGYAQGGGNPDAASSLLDQHRGIRQARADALYRLLASCRVPPRAAAR